MNTPNKKAEKSKILRELEIIQKFIEKQNAVDRYGRKIDDFNKLCFVQEDLTKLKKLIKKK
jgi:hypothetical protein